MSGKKYDIFVIIIIPSCILHSFKSLEVFKIRISSLLYSPLKICDCSYLNYDLYVLCNSHVYSFAIAYSPKTSKAGDLGLLSISTAVVGLYAQCSAGLSVAFLLTSADFDSTEQQKGCDSSKAVPYGPVHSYV